MSRASITIENGRFRVEAGPRDVDLVREIQGLKHDHRRGAWYGPLRWGICLQLRGIFGEELAVSDEVYEFGAAQVQAEQLVHHLKAGAYRDNLRGFPWAENLLEFQLDSVPQMSQFATVINSDEMGAGKTVQTARALDHAMRLHDAGAAWPLPALVVCTVSMQDTWAEELTKWTPGIEPLVVRGSAAKRRKMIEDARDYAGAGDVGGGHALVMTWGALRTHTRLSGYGSMALKRCVSCDARVGDPALKETACEVHPRELNGGWIRTVIADEAHKAANPKAKQTQALWAVAHAAHYRWPLTGTPVRNAPEDLWALLHLIDPEAWPSRNKFIDRYALSVAGRWGGIEILGWNPATLPELERLMAPYFICRPKSVIQPYLPPIVPDHRWAHMEPKQAKPYNDMVKNHIAIVDGEIIAGLDELTVQTRLRQFALGTPVMGEKEIMTEDGPEVVQTVEALAEPSCKVDVFLDLLDELAGKSVVAFAESKLLINLMAEVLEKKGFTYVTITGDVDAATRKANVDKFQAGEAQVFLGTLAAASEGITLTRADTLVFLQRSWNMVHNRQAAARIHRHGQVAESVTIIDVVTKGTIEEAVFETVQDKEEILQAVLKDPAWVRRAIKGET